VSLQQSGQLSHQADVNLQATSAGCYWLCPNELFPFAEQRTIIMEFKQHRQGGSLYCIVTTGIDFLRHNVWLQAIAQNMISSPWDSDLADIVQQVEQQHLDWGDRGERQPHCCCQNGECVSKRRGCRKLDVPTMQCKPVAQLRTKPVIVFTDSASKQRNETGHLSKLPTQPPLV